MVKPQQCFGGVPDGASVGGLSLGGAVAVYERSRNSADAHGSASVERCQQAVATFFSCGCMRPWSREVLSLWAADEGHSVQGVRALEHKMGAEQVVG